jgi:hypothetical protein
METTGSATETETIQETKNKTMVLRLREKKVLWSEDVVNNENMNKKTSKSKRILDRFLLND